MKVVVLYRYHSEQARRIDDFVRDFQRRYAGRKLELVDVDSRDGSSTASLYDVWSFPAILATTDDGQLLKDWQGDHLPLLEEVFYYSNS